MKHGPKWYPREPRAIIDAKRAARMTTRQAAVYDLIIDLIYEGDGETPDNPRYVASHFADVGSAAARKTIQSLVDMNKLIRRGEMLTQKRAETVTETRRNLVETRRKAGQIGGVSSGASRRTSREINGQTEANASRAVEQSRVDKSREDKDANATPFDASDRSAEQARFSEFWAAYPRKENQTKAEAEFLSSSHRDRCRHDHRRSAGVRRFMGPDAIASLCPAPCKLASGPAMDRPG